MIAQPITGTPREAASRQRTGRRAMPRRSLRLMATVSAVVFLILLVDALLHPRADFDLRLMQEIQAVEIPGLAEAIAFQEVFTDSSGAVVAWAVALVLMTAFRRWVVLLGLLTLPAGGAVNYVVGDLVGRSRPDLDVLIRASTNYEERSFPSGHVQGAVMLYGFLFAVAEQIRIRVLRRTIQLGCAAVIATVGVARIWDGAHWPSDILAGYALGGLMLAGLLAAYRRVDVAVGDVPLIHAAAVPHDEGQRHAHALTSTILFRGDRVAKIYNPGLVPRAIYWLAFQAPFAYERNLDALRAAVLRRNLAGMLTEHWYGSNRVSRALGIERIAGRYALIGTFIEGTEPRDHHAARRFLHDLADRFDEAGLPTWQIDPRQPRSLGNILERHDGTYAVIDLESGLVSPLASPRAWMRALRRALVPIYDDIYFDLTRAYVERQAEAMYAVHGHAWLADLRATLDEAEAATAAWHAGEPRIWSRLVRGTRTGFGVKTWQARAERGRDRAAAWLDKSIASWEADGRLTPEQASIVRVQVNSPQFQAVLPHFGVFLTIGIALRFPFGSIARVTYLLANQTVATVRLLTRRTDHAKWRWAMGVHSPLVLLVATVPGVGTFAYLAAAPVRSNHLLVRVALDAVLLRFPWRVYERTRLRRLIARPTTAVLAPTGTAGSSAEPTDLEARASSSQPALEPGTTRLQRSDRKAAEDGHSAPY